VSAQFNGQLRRHFPSLVLIPCVALTGFGLYETPVLKETLWLPQLAGQLPILFAVVAVVALAVCGAAVRYRLRPESLLAIVLLAVATTFCGAAPVLVVLFFLMSSWCLASIVLSRFGPATNGLPVVVTLAAGWAAYALLFSVMASIPINTTATHSLILAAPIALALALRGTRAELVSRLANLLIRTEPAVRIEWVYLAGLIVSVTILAFHVAVVALPERFYDAMTTHLYIPSYISAHRAWSYDADSYVFAYLPIGGDMLYTDMFLIGGETAARLLNFAAFFFTCIATFRIAVQASSSRAAAAWAITMLVSLPMTLTESASLFVENAVALFITVAVLVLTEARFRIGLVHYCAVIMLMAGASVVKLHGVVAAIPIGAIALALCVPKLKTATRWVQLAVISLVGVAGASWPYAYAWVKTGNPFLPLFNHIFKSPYFDPKEFVDPRWVGKMTPWFLYDATFSTKNFVEVLGGGAMGFGFLVFLAAGYAVAVVRPNRTTLLCGGLGLGLIALLAAKTQYLRYLLIFFPLLIVMIAVALEHFGQFRKLRVPLALLTAAVVLLNVYKIPAGGWIVGLGTDLRAAFSPNIYRQLELTVPERIVNRIINDQAGPMARVLYMNNPFGALLTGTAIYTTWYNTKLKFEFVGVSTDEGFAALMAKVAPTHVVLDTGSQRPLDKLATTFLKAKATLLVRVGGLALYQL
jgi:hypothetical protein